MLDDHTETIDAPPTPENLNPYGIERISVGCDVRAKVRGKDGTMYDIVIFNNRAVTKNHDLRAAFIMGGAQAEEEELNQAIEESGVLQTNPNLKLEKVEDGFADLRFPGVSDPGALERMLENNPHLVNYKETMTHEVQEELTEITKNGKPKDEFKDVSQEVANLAGIPQPVSWNSNETRKQLDAIAQEIKNQLPTEAEYIPYDPNNLRNSRRKDGSSQRTANPRYRAEVELPWEMVEGLVANGACSIMDQDRGEVTGAILLISQSKLDQIRQTPPKLDKDNQKTENVSTGYEMNGKPVYFAAGLLKED